MSPAVVRRLLRLYPARWRERYGEEFSALLETHPATPGAVADVLVGAVVAHGRALAARARAQEGRDHRVWLGSSSVRHAARSLRRTPVFTATALLTLIIGLGSTAAMFAVVDGVLLQPLPYDRPAELVTIVHDAQAPMQRRIPQTTGTYLTYRRLARTTVSIGLFTEGSANIAGVAESDVPERVTGSWMTASVFPTLRVQPLLGRWFTDDEDRPQGPNVVVIGEGLWRTRFGGAPDVLGKMIGVNNVPRQIIGVMPETFRFPTPAARLWLPVRLDTASRFGGGFLYSVIARLRPGVAPEDARRDFAAALSRFAELYPFLEPDVSTATWLAQARPTPSVVSLHDDVTVGVARTLWIVAAAAGLVLLVACANVANLVLVRADARQREIAVREALGAGRWRVNEQFVVESVILAVVAGIAALAAAWMAVRFFVASAPPGIPRLAELHVGAPVVGFVVVSAVLVALLCAAVPTLRLGKAGHSIALRESSRSVTWRRAQHRLRGTIAAAQLSLALVVTAGSGLLFRTVQRLHDERPGFDPTDVTIFWLQLPISRYGQDSTVLRFYSRLTAQVASLPGVRRVGLASHLPLGGGDARQSLVFVDGSQPQRTGAADLQTFLTIDDGYLAAMGIPLLAGRSFEHSPMPRDREAIVSQQTAAELWSDSTGRAAVGKSFRMLANGPLYTVIGVAGNVRDRSLAIPPAPTVYLPFTVTGDNTVLGQRARRTMALVVKTSSPSPALAAAVQRVVRDLDTTVPTFDVAAMNDLLSASTARLSFTLELIAAAAVITLVLGAVGLYGVMAYLVSLRARELGVRMALGATPATVAAMVTRRGVKVAGAGIAGGLLLFAPIGGALRAFLYGVAPADPLTLIGASVTLFGVSLLASWVPARRAARLSPIAALRAD